MRFSLMLAVLFTCGAITLATGFANSVRAGDDLAPLVGTWVSRIQLGNDPEYFSLYTFDQEGNMREDTYTLDRQPLGSFEGRATRSGDRMTIRWTAGAVERATIRLVAPDKMQYRITAHSDDPRQVGNLVVFSRLDQPAEVANSSVTQLQARVRQLTTEREVCAAQIEANRHQYESGKHRAELEQIRTGSYPYTTAQIYLQAHDRMLDGQVRLDEIERELRKVESALIRANHQSAGSNPR